MVATAEESLGLRLRSGLQAERREVDGRDIWLIEDPLRSRFYRLGEMEYAFANGLNNGIRTAVAAANEYSEGEPITETEAKQILAWLQHEGLLEDESSSSSNADKPLSLMRLLNPLIIRIPLTNPDRWLSRQDLTIRALTGPFAFGLWLMMVLSALLIVVTHRTELFHASSGILYQGNWLALLGVWLVAKLAHEISHGLVCKRYGGNVFEAGVILVLFLPMGYVDASSSWRFTRRRERIFVALAGLYAELFLAALAAWVWLFSPSGIVSDLALNMIIVAGVTSLLFNANPLMRFDGYFALSDLLDIPNLYTAGQQEMSWLWRRYVLGLPVAHPVRAHRRKALVIFYGFATWVWRIMVIATLLVAAAYLLGGAGIILSILAAIGIVYGMAKKSVPLWQAMDSQTRVSAAARAVLILGTLTAVLSLISWQPGVRVPAVVEHSGLEAVRVKTPGFVREVWVSAGEAVRAGDKLVTLENESLQLKRRLLALDLQAAELGHRQRLSAGNLAEAQRQSTKVLSLRKELSALDERIGELQIEAISDGIVDGVAIASLRGRYLTEGEEVLAVVAPQHKRLRASIDVREIGELAGLDASAAFWGRASLSVQMHQSSARASVEPGPEAALAHPLGGPLAVLTRVDDTGKTVFNWLSPRVTLFGALTPEQAQVLRAGELASIRLQGNSVNAIAWLYQKIGQWLDHLLESSAGSA